MNPMPVSVRLKPELKRQIERLAKAQGVSTSAFIEGALEDKVQRPDVITVPVDPQLAHFAQVAAIARRQTLTSFIEWAVEEGLKQVTLKPYREDLGDDREPNYDGSGTYRPPDLVDLEKHSVAAMAHLLWDNDAAMRQKKLHIYYPNLPDLPIANAGKKR